MPDTIKQIFEIFRDRGGRMYLGEEVTQLQHALQAATLAERAGASAEQIVAALLHDIGHMLDELNTDGDTRGADDAHEEKGFCWLSERMPLAVVDPVRLHVAAKRYLCTVEPSYQERLSPVSLQSFLDQGGLLSADEVAQFEAEPYSAEAVMLRRRDDAAKDTECETPDIEHFRHYLQAALPL